MTTAGESASATAERTSERRRGIGTAAPAADEHLDIVLTVQHPAHVHFFKNAYHELTRRGHEVHVFLREKSVARELLDTFDIDYEVLAGQSDGIASLATSQLGYEWRLLQAARRIQPDVMAAIGGMAVAHVASLVGAQSVVFTDTEHATLSNRLTFPFADVVCTPECFRDDVGEKHHEYAGYHELAYLHPDRFTADASVLDEVGLSRDDDYVVLRLIAWGASHDVGQGGFGDVTEVVERLEATGRKVLITAEGDLPDEVADRQATIDPHRLHDLLYYADLFVGEGATTAVESAVLGTPAVYVNTLSMGYTDELDERYDLLYGFHGEDRHRRALDAAVEVLEDDADWGERRINLLTEKRDVTNVIVSELLAATDDG